MINFDPHTATQQELRDWLAEQDAWIMYVSVTNRKCWVRVQPDDNPPIECPDDHPFPPTLDGAAAALPEGWEWEKSYPQDDEGPWKARLPFEHLVSVPDTGDEITDRYRLACLARVAMKEKAQ